MGKGRSGSESGNDGKPREFSSKDAMKLIAAGKVKIRRIISAIPSLEKSVSGSQEDVLRGISVCAVVVCLKQGMAFSKKARSSSPPSCALFARAGSRQERLRCS